MRVVRGTQFLNAKSQEVNFQDYKTEKYEEKILLILRKIMASKYKSIPHILKVINSVFTLMGS